MQPLFIGPYDKGQSTNLKPFMLPENAFETLFNAYVFRGRIRRKSGYGLLGQLQRNIGTTDSSGAATITISPQPIDPGIAIFTVGSNIFTDPGGASPVTLLTNGPGTAILDRTSGILTITGSNLTTAVQYYPGLPVIGIWQHIIPSQNVAETFFFDTRYAYSYNFITQQFQGLAPNTTIWTGADYQLFWGVNYWYNSSGAQYFWVTNFNAFEGTFDPIRYYNPSTPAWIDFAPQLASTGTPYLFQCLMLIPYKGRMLAFNTMEGPNSATLTQYKQRVRWSWVGDPTNQTEGWYSDIAGHGGYLDAWTSEEIIAAGFVKDQLIVYFERSTWQLAYTGNELLPFVFQRINTELGADSTFSNVRLDNALICFGNIGVHSTNGVNTGRIDQDNPNIIFDVSDQNNGPDRTFGIRDNFRELIYWAYVDDLTNPYLGSGIVGYRFPNRIMCYNYVNQTFSFFDDHFTCLGYFQNSNFMKWSDLTEQHPFYPSWQAWTDPWASTNSETDYPAVIAGNQQGYILQLNPDGISNSVTLSVQNIQLNTPIAGQMLLTVPNHNLPAFPQGTYFIIYGVIGGSGGMTGINGTIYQMFSPGTSDTNSIYTKMSGTETGTYIGGGRIKVLSNIEIKTKQFPPFWNNSKRYRLIKAEYLFDRTDQGQVQANIYTNMVSSGIGSTVYSMTDPDNFRYDSNPNNTTLLGNNVISTAPEADILYQKLQNQIWKRQYTIVEGDTFQIQLIMGQAQMTSLGINESQITLHAMIFHFEEAGEFR